MLADRSIDAAATLAWVVAKRIGNHPVRLKPTLVVVLTALAAFLTFIGGTIGGSLVFDYAFNVATAGDSRSGTSRKRTSCPAKKAAYTCASLAVRCRRSC